jgi:hypothetical protein
VGVRAHIDPCFTLISGCLIDSFVLRPKQVISFYNLLTNRIRKSRTYFRGKILLAVL